MSEHFQHTPVSAIPPAFWWRIHYCVHRGVRADGEEFPIEATISQVGGGEEKFFTVVLRDITKRR